MKHYILSLMAVGFADSPDEEPIGHHFSWHKLEDEEATLFGLKYPTQIVLNIPENIAEMTRKGIEFYARREVDLPEVLAAYKARHHILHEPINIHHDILQEYADRSKYYSSIRSTR